MSLVSDYRACQDLPARQAFLFQHCQDMMERLEQQEEELSKIRHALIHQRKLYTHVIHPNATIEYCEKLAKRELKDEGLL